MDEKLLIYDIAEILTAKTDREKADIETFIKTAFALAETCVFAKQSPGPFHCGQLALAPLLANLRGHFAEFLNNSSLAHFRILSSSTCVGLRYGHLQSRQRLFLTVWNLQLPVLFFPPRNDSAFLYADLPTYKPYRLHTLYQRRALLILLCPHFT